MNHLTTLCKIVENMQTLKDHPKPEVKRLALNNTIELTEALPQNVLTEEMQANFEFMKIGGFNKIKYLRNVEIKRRLDYVY